MGGYPELESNNGVPARKSVRLERKVLQRRTSFTISPPRECATKMMGRSRYLNMRWE